VDFATPAAQNEFHASELFSFRKPLLFRKWQAIIIFLFFITIISQHREKTII
jgi:hypothetical protein